MVSSGMARIPLKWKHPRDRINEAEASGRMTILYLTPSHVDYLSDQIYTGLCNILGWESVVDYPYKRYYHDPHQKMPFIPQNPGRMYQFDEIVALLDRREFDFVVVSAIRKEPLEAIELLFNKCSLPPLVLLDGDDGTQIKADLFRRYEFALYFKREYPDYEDGRLGRRWAGLVRGWLDRDLAGRTFPLPFSVILEGMPTLEAQDRDIDISFVGIASHRDRIRAVNILRGASDIRFEGQVYADHTTRRSKLVVGTLAIWKAKLQGDPYASKEEQKGKLSWAEYCRLMARSKVGFSIRGAGFDTMRYWEIVASKTLLISERPSILIPNNFVHGQHAVFCRPDLSDLLDLVRAYARDDIARRTIAEEGYRHLLRFHTCEQRARQFLDICKKSL